MIIGLMTAPSRPVPPKELSIHAPKHLIAELANNLVDRGHVVYLFASKQSKTKAELCDFGIEPTNVLEKTMTAEAYDKKVRVDEAFLFQKMIAFGIQKNIDIYHLHNILHMKPLIDRAPSTCKFVITLHDPIIGKYREAVDMFSLNKNVFFVTISQAQQGDIKASFIQTVPNGIRTDMFPYSSTSQGYLAIMGRMVPKKGADDAIIASSQTKDPLYLVGQQYLDGSENQTFWEHRIAPYIDNKMVHYVSIMDRSKLYHYYQGAKALLMPVKWEEPFGLVMVEAMSCGTPVIAYNRGSISEVIKDGITGFIIDSNDEPRPGKGTWTIKKQGIDGLVEAIGRIGEIDRKACRRHVEEHFTVEKMVDGYEEVYAKILHISHT